MKKILFTLAYLFLIQLAYAQGGNETVFIFNEFETAKVHFKNKTITITPMNYDAAKSRMCFMQDGTIMELTNAAAIDSIVWSEQSRKFITHGRLFLEEIKLSNNTVYINWKVRNVNTGSKGALGIRTQAKVEAINIRALGVYSNEDNKNHIDIYELKNNNEYYLPIQEKWEKIKTPKQLIQLFPEYKEEINTYIKNRKVDATKTTAMLQLIEFCSNLRMTDTK